MAPSNSVRGSDEPQSGKWVRFVRACLAGSRRVSYHISHDDSPSPPVAPVVSAPWSGLTESQVQRIAENRRQALMRQQKRLQLTIDPLYEDNNQPPAASVVDPATSEMTGAFSVPALACLGGSSAPLQSFVKSNPAVASGLPIALADSNGLLIAHAVNFDESSLLPKSPTGCARNVSDCSDNNKPARSQCAKRRPKADNHRPWSPSRGRPITPADWAAFRAPCKDLVWSV